MLEDSRWGYNPHVYTYKSEVIRMQSPGEQSKINAVQVDVRINHIRKSSTRKFDDVQTTFESLLGKPTLKSVAEAVAGAEAEKTIEGMAGPSGLMMLGLIQMGEAVPYLKEKGIRSNQYLVGNPLIADKMIRHNQEAALYAPLRILMSEDEHGTYFVYDRPSSLFGQWHSLEIDNVASKLDQLLDNLIDAALKSDSPTNRS